MELYSNLERNNPLILMILHFFNFQKNPNQPIFAQKISPKWKTSYERGNLDSRVSELYLIPACLFSENEQNFAA